VSNRHRRCTPSIDCTSIPGSTLTLTAFFAPKGLAGLGYWYGLYPVHGRIFSGTIEELGRRAEASAQEHRGPDARAERPAAV
jgi:hypothetical protein